MIFDEQEELQALEDKNRLDWLEENKAEITIHLEDPFRYENEKRYYLITWDNLKKSVTDKNLRETIDKAMSFKE